MQHRHHLAAAPVGLGQVARSDDQRVAARSLDRQRRRRACSSGSTITRSPSATPSTSHQIAERSRRVAPAPAARACRSTHETRTSRRRARPAPPRARRHAACLSGAPSSRSRNATLRAHVRQHARVALERSGSSPAPSPWRGRPWARSAAPPRQSAARGARRAGSRRAARSSTWRGRLRRRRPRPPACSMSAIVTTAPLVSAALENGVMLSPTLAFLVSTTPSNGARIRVWSSATSAA